MISGHPYNLCWPWRIPPLTCKEDEANGFRGLQNCLWHCSWLYYRFNQHQKVKLQFQERKSGKSSSCEEHKVWSKVIPQCSPPPPPESGTVSQMTWSWLSPSLCSRDCSMHGMGTSFMSNLGFALFLQFNFNSLALSLLTSFRFATPSFFACFRFVAKAVFFGCLLTAI